MKIWELNLFGSKTEENGKLWYYLIVINQLEKQLKRLFFIIITVILL